jgi:hypothetical protein
MFQPHDFPSLSFLQLSDVTPCLSMFQRTEREAMGDKYSASHRRGPHVAGRCLAITTSILFVSCMALMFLLLRDLPATAGRLSRGSRLTWAQVDTRGMGIQHVVLAGNHGGLPIVVNVWFRVVCAGSFTVLRGFATGEEAAGPLTVIQGHILPPTAILIDLPPLFVQLSDGSRVTLTTWGPLEPGRVLPRDTWHLQATFSSDHAAVLIGVTGWDQTMQVPPQPECRADHNWQQEQQQQNGGLGLLSFPQQQEASRAAPWMTNGAIWGILALPPLPSRSPKFPAGDLARSAGVPCAAGSVNTSTSGSNSSQADPLVRPAALQQAVGATLASLKAAGAAGLLVIATNPSHVTQLMAAPAPAGLKDAPLHLWLWVSLGCVWVCVVCEGVGVGG